MARNTSAVERRKHKRHRLACPLSWQKAADPSPVKVKTIDVSDGGAMVTVPIKVVPRLADRVKVVLAVPRSTPNTYMLEEITLDAKVVRHQPLEDNESVGVALQFTSAQDLGLEV